MREVRFSSSRSAKAVSSVCSLFVLAGMLGWIEKNRDTSPHPISRLASESSGVNVQGCAECHSEIVANFATAPHAKTLRPGTDEQIRAIFAGRSADQGGRTFSFTEQAGELWFGSDDLEYRRRVDWVFGSGQHALTPVSMDRQGSTQLSISYYADGKFRATPGVPESRSGVPNLGHHESAADTRRCFGCHVSRMSEDSFSNMKANVDCARCHFGAEEHARSGGDLATTPSWPDLSPLQSVNRCGECHRRPDEMKPQEISVHETHLVRFAPVGLVKSRCFAVANAPENSGIYPRLDCTTCHDPHLPSRTEAAYFEAICRSCHTSGQSHAEAHFVACRAEAVDSACLSCHMTKTDFAPGLRFTDHWIR